MRHTKYDRIPIWIKALRIWIALLLLAGFAVCAVLYRYLAVYEKTRPEYVMDSLLSEGYSSLCDQAAASLNPSVNPYEDIRSIYKNYCDTYLSGDKLSYTEDMEERTESTAEYTIYAGVSELCQVIVGQTEVSYFGRKVWQVKQISVGNALNSLHSISVKIISMRGMPVYLNGVLVEQDYASKEIPELSDLTEIERHFTSAPEPIQYIISPFYGSITISDGNNLEQIPEYVTETEAVYRVLPEKHNLCIEAPEGICVSVGGVPLSIESASEWKDGIFEGVTEFTGTPIYKTAVYQVNGLYTVPEVTAKDEDGAILPSQFSDDGIYHFYYESDESVTAEMRDYVKNFFVAYMEYSSNGSTGGRFTELIDRIKAATPLHSYVLNSYEAMQWASKTELNYQYLNFDHYHMVNKYCFTCTVSCSIDMKTTSWVEKTESNLTGFWHIVMVNNGGYWIAAAIKEVS